MTTDRPFGKHRGAVSLTFDDGLPSHLDVAMPMMEKHGLRGTFYVSFRGKNWKQKTGPWVEAARRGHELGNHTTSHTCSENLTNRSEGLESRTVDEIEADIIKAQGRLVELDPGRKDWTFAYPCYQTHVGRGEGRQSYVPVVAKHFIAGRSQGEFGFANCPQFVDLACCSAIPCERRTGFEMIGLAEEMAKEGKWLILAFHCFDGGWLGVAQPDFERLLAFLERRKDDIWTGTVAEVAGRVRDYQREALKG